MLVLTRGVGQSIELYQDGNRIATLKVTQFKNSREVKIGIDAGKEIVILRSELQLKGENNECNKAS